MSDVTPFGDRVETQPRYTVAAVARRLGVAPGTLRTWDRRYGLGPTDHESGTRRRYDPHDLARLELMRRLTLDGVAPAEAARLALAAVPREPDDPPAEPHRPAAHLTAPHLTAPHLTGPHLTAPHPTGPTGPHPAGPHPTGPHPAGPAAPRPVSSVATAPVAAGTGAGSGGRILPLPGASPAARGLARAAMALDAEAIRRIVGRGLDVDGVTATWNRLLRPVLVAAGRRWELSGAAVDVEHVLTECVRAALRAYADGIRVGHTRPILLACGPGESHSLPLYAVAAGLAERGVPTRMLGAAVPRAALHSAVTRTGPSAVLLWALLRSSADPGAIDGLPATRPPTNLVVAGPGWQGLPLPARTRRVESLEQAVDVLTRR